MIWLAKRHEGILDALKAHDPKAASLVMRHHMEQAAEIRESLAGED